MIQRIQSIYLLLASICSASVYGLPFATTSQGQSDSTLFADSQFNVFDSVSLMGLFGMVAFLAIGAIFLYNNRKLQGNVTIFGIALTICALAFTFMTLTNDAWAKSNMSGFQISVGAFLPFLSIVFYFMAKRNISKDDKLVKSMDRLR